MKISKRELKRMIQEERTRIVVEQAGANMSQDEWYEVLSDAQIARAGGPVPAEGVPALIAALKMMAEDLQYEIDHPEEY
jgi:hypothetical protein